MTDWRLRFLVEIEADLEDGAEYYDSRSPGLGGTFLLDFESTLKLVAENPRHMQTVQLNNLPGEVRRWQLRRFPFSIVYQLSDDTITIVAVPHGMQRPGFWRDRLK
jgi:plasmid stabilization system protein ParE